MKPVFHVSMKYGLIVLLLSLVGFATAQSCCGNHLEEEFPSVFTRDSVYALAQETYSGTLVNLSLRIYDTQENTCTKRPLLILVHGGAFGGGSYTQMSELANRFAKRGYLVISAGYRIGFASAGALCPADTSELIRAWYRGMQDIRSSIRWAKARHNSLRIDTNLVFLSGWSAGAYISSGIAFLNLPQEKPVQTYAIEDIASNGNLFQRPDLGPPEGLSNLNGSSDDIAGFASFSGAFLFPENIPQGNKPASLFFNNRQDDYNVPFETCVQDLWEYNCPQGYPTVCGIEAMTSTLEGLGIIYDYRVYDTVPCGHNMHIPCFPMFEDEVSLMATFFNNVMECNSATSVGFNESLQATKNLILDEPKSEISWKYGDSEVLVYNIQGRLVQEVFPLSGKLLLELPSAGLYFLKSKEGSNLVQRVLLK